MIVMVVLVLVTITLVGLLGASMNITIYEYTVISIDDLVSLKKTACGILTLNKHISHTCASSSSTFNRGAIGISCAIFKSVVMRYAGTYTGTR